MRAALPWLALLVALALLCHQVTMPATVAPGPAHRESAWLPYVQADYGGATSWCVSSASGRVMPPFIDTGP